MRNLNKKGFTIVELVIVIAVIAILAGVLIPTFGGIVNKANESAALQKATAANTAARVYADDGNTEGYYIKVTQAKKDYYYTVEDNELEVTTAKTVYETVDAAETACNVGTTAFVLLSKLAELTDAKEIAEVEGVYAPYVCVNAD